MAPFTNDHESLQKRPSKKRLVKTLVKSILWAKLSFESSSIYRSAW